MEKTYDLKYGNEDRAEHGVDIFNRIQKVQDTVIHLELDEEQWKIDHTRKQEASQVGVVPTCDVRSTVTRCSSCTTNINNGPRV